MEDSDDIQELFFVDTAGDHQEVVELQEEIADPPEEEEEDEWNVEVQHTEVQDPEEEEVLCVEQCDAALVQDTEIQDPEEEEQEEEEEGAFCDEQSDAAVVPDTEIQDSRADLELQDQLRRAELRDLESQIEQLQTQETLHTETEAGSHVAEVDVVQDTELQDQLRRAELADLKAQIAQFEAEPTALMDDHAEVPEQQEDSAASDCQPQVSSIATLEEGEECAEHTEASDDVAMQEAGEGEMAHETEQAAAAGPSGAVWCCRRRSAGEMQAKASSDTMGEHAGGSDMALSVEVDETVPASSSSSPRTSGANVGAGLGRTGYVFLCNSKTQMECEQLHLLGAPQADLERMKKNIKPADTLLFLLNFQTLKLMGPFLSLEEVSKSIVPNAFGGKFSAQVGVEPLDTPLREAKVEKRVPAGPKTVDQTESLAMLLQGGQEAPAKVQESWNPCEPAGKRQKLDDEAGRGVSPVLSADSGAEVDLENGEEATVGADNDGDFPHPAVYDLTGANGDTESWGPDDETNGTSCANIESPVANDEEVAPMDMSQRTGYVFVCNKATQQECEALKVLGGPEKEFERMKKCIHPDTLLFLLNFDSLKLVGAFMATEAPRLNIVQGAFNGRFKAQVRVAPMQPLAEIQLDQRIPAGPKNADEVETFRQWMQGDEAGDTSDPRLQAVWGGSSMPSSQGSMPSPRPSTPLSPGSPGLPGDFHAKPPADKKRRLNGAAHTLADEDGRPYNLQRVVVNFANVGATYASVVLKKDSKRGDRLFDWEGVRKCIKCLANDQRMQVIGVVFENLWGPDNGKHNVGIPNDIRKMCHSIQETPRLDGRNHKSADDEVTIKCAYRRNCRFLDNDNYRDWKCGMRDAKCRRWLEGCQEFMQMRYFFDSELGCFDVLDGNIPAGYLVSG